MIQLLNLRGRGVYLARKEESECTNMKICKSCGAEQVDEARFCNLCGQPLEAEELTEEPAAEELEEQLAIELPEEADEETTEEASEEVTEETSETPAKKKTPWGWIIGLVAAVVLVVVLILAKGNAGAGKPVSLTSGVHTNGHGFESHTVHYTENEDAYEFYYTNADAERVELVTESVNEMMDKTVASVGVLELTNRDLQYYFDQQYYYFYTMYSSYLTYMMDMSLGLDEQQDMNQEGTWQDYFLSAAVDMFHQVAALYQTATEEGFLPTAEEQEQMDAAMDLETQAKNYGYEDVDQFMRDYFGPFATVDSYREFVRVNMISSFYAAALVERVTVTEDEVAAYYDANAASLLGNQGIQKVDKNVIDIRHILITPEQAEDGTISDEAWAAAEAQANELYEQWKAGEATEETFAEMANANSTDPGSNTNGGLYTDVYPGQMVTEFNDWCFADGRQTGDHGVVKTSYGYHIMYFSGEGGYVFWKMYTEELLLNERAAEERNAIVMEYELESQLDKAIVMDMNPPTEPVAETAAETETE